MTRAYVMNGYVEKMSSPDQDFRYMALNDIMNDVKQDPNNFSGDENVETKVLHNVLLLIEDKISEVKNQAVKCLGVLIKVVRENQMEVIMDKLIELFGRKDEETRDIAGLALKTITTELPQDSKLAAKTCTKLGPKLLLQLQDSTTTSESVIDILAILSALVTRFPLYMSDTTLQPKPLVILIALLQHPRPAVQKRAIITLAQFLPPSQPESFNGFLYDTMIPNLKGFSTNLQIYVQLVAAVARYTPQRIAPALPDIVPVVLRASTRDDPELRESVLQALETIVLRCPTEIAPFLTSIIGLGIQLIKYDPNYAEGDNGDDDMEMDDANEDSDAGLDDYSDDEDTSYKIRRSSTKLLAAIIGTRPELLQTLYKDVSPVLISRFGDREVSVKLEIWSTYVLLLNQTALYGGASKYKDNEAFSPLKRKRRDSDEGMDLDGSPISLLKSQVPSLCKQLFHQLKGSKVAPNVLQNGFTVLTALLHVISGVLSTQAAQAMSLSKSALSQQVSTTTAPLHISALSFLTLFFATHSPAAFGTTISTITPTLLRCLKQKHPRVTSESFRAFSALLKALKPLKTADWVVEIYSEALTRLKANDTDAQVRQCAEDCIGDLWVCAPDIVRSRDGKEWDAILRSTERTENPIRVITYVAKEGDVTIEWIDGCVNWIFNVLKKSGRIGKAEAFGSLEVLLRRYYSGIPTTLPSTLLPLLQPYLSSADILLLSHTLATLSALLELAPALSFPLIEKNVLKDVYSLTSSPLISGASLDTLLMFYGLLVRADPEISTRVVPSLVLEVERGSKSSITPGNVAKCIARVVQGNMAIAAGTVAEFAKIVKNPSSKITSIVLGLLTLGELGRFISMADQSHIFDMAVGCFNSESEDIRAAGAFAAGNIAIGDMSAFLSPIVRMVQSDTGKRLLALHALKEVVSHCSQAQLEQVADALWEPLFDNSENSEEASRNVAASCLGKLTTTKPSQYLPQLQARLHDHSPVVRATVISALRYTLADVSRSYDELLAPVIVDFLALMVDQDLTVQRLTLQALNSAARNKPALIRDHLTNLLPQLYAETIPKPELIEIVQMGPWQHKVDKGLDARKAAYEAMYTLLDTCLSKIDLHTFLERVLSGLKDDSDEIKVICHMMLFRMSQIVPAAVAQRLDEASEPLGKTMAVVVVGKDTVKQDIERASELQRSALRAIAALSKVSIPGGAPHFDAMVEKVKGGQYASEFKEMAAS